MATRFEQQHRREQLAAALNRVGCSLQLATFCHLLFNGQFGGVPDEWVRISYAELAMRPYRLCCTTAQAELVVREAVRLGLVKVQTHQAACGADDPNSYTLDWAGIEARAQESTPVA